MKIAYVTNYDASDIHNWSGTGFAIAKMLENQNAEIDYIGNLKVKANFNLKLKNKLYKQFSEKQFMLSRTPFVAKGFANQVKNRLTTNTDIIFSPGTVPIAFLESNQPKVIYTDATFAGMLGFYDGFSNLSRESIKHGNYLEQKALASSQLNIFSSDWAAQSAIDNYNVNPDKIKVVPFGSNIITKRDGNEIKKIISNRNQKELNLLFLGVDWGRKGGDLAVKIAEELNLLGLKTTLHIVGIKELPFDITSNFVINHGYISKKTKEGNDKIEKLLFESHFLLLPSIADCTPIVYSETNAFGLPCITTNVGGIPTIIKDNINGMKFNLTNHVDDWCNYILETFTNKQKYNALCCSSFNEYETRLNWDVAGKTIMNLMKDL